MGAIWKTVFGIRAEETTFARRGFRSGENGRREHMEKVGTAFVQGYHAALEDSAPSSLVPHLEAIESNWRGFAYEGAAMALALQDRITFWRRDRIARFLAGPAAAHPYVVHVGVGWAAARLPGSLESYMAPLDPLLRWLVVDGYGFHEGFFHWPRCLNNAPRPGRVRGYAERVFDQGLGRSLWFVEGGNVIRIHESILAFSKARQPDLWSGVGLAAVYAGGVNDAELGSLAVLAGDSRPQLAQGAAFAAKARCKAGHATGYTDRACLALCGMSGADAAAVTDSALENLPANTVEPAYEAWRRRVQEALAAPREVRT